MSCVADVIDKDKDDVIVAGILEGGRVVPGTIPGGNELNTGPPIYIAFTLSLQGDHMTAKKSGLELVRAWLDALEKPATEQEQSKALQDMIRIALSKYDPNVVSKSTTKSVHSRPQYR